MSFHKNLDKIVDGLIKQVSTETVKSSGSKILDNHLASNEQERQIQEKCENANNLVDVVTGKIAKTSKTKVKPTIKIPKITGKKKITKEIFAEPKDDEIVARFQEKELSINQNKIKTTLKEKSTKKKSSETFAVGKRMLVIDETNFNPDYEKFLKTNSISTNDQFIDDTLRGRSGKYWSLNKESNNFTFVGKTEEYGIRSPFVFDFHETLNDDEITDFGRTYQIVGIESVKNQFQTAKLKYSKDLWKSFVVGKKYNGSTKYDEKLDLAFESTIKEDKVFFDHAFDLNLPFEEKYLEKINLSNALSTKTNLNYNFYIEEYEKAISRKDVKENTLPNMYVMLSEMNTEFPNPEFKRLISLDNTIQIDSKKLLTFKKKNKQLNKSRVYDLKTNPIGEYFDLFGRQYAQAIKNGVIDKLDSKFSNIAISIDDLELIKQFTDKQELFPLNIHIKFETDKTTVFAQILKDTNLSDAFVNKIINRIVKNSFDLISTEESIENTIQLNGELARKKASFKKENRKTWDLADIIVDLQDGQEPLAKNVVYLGDYDRIQRSENKPEFKFFRSLNSEIFQSKIQTLIRDKMRSYEDIINGDLAYSETVLYRIAKFVGTEINNTPIQNIWIPNATNVDVIDYVDTQVKYDKNYTYIVYAYQFVLGNKYWYSDTKIDDYDHHATFRVYQEPSLRLVEVPYFKFNGRVVDKPPAPPEVNFVAYKGVDNKFLIMFNNSVTEFKAHPIIINSSDQDNFNKIKQSQKLETGEKITFGGDDRIAQYEIYRLNKKPKSYKDFENHLQAVIETDVNKETSQKATSASTIEIVEPNKKYWYVFRAIDIHGHISNPTFLYEAEIINEHGTVFPLINVVDFQESIEKQPSKNLKRFIQIIPTVLQGLIDEESSGFKNAKTAEQIKNQISLGLAERKVWGKTFRIRIISKQTGRKIEFDINFQHQTISRVKSE